MAPKTTMMGSCTCWPGSGHGEAAAVLGCAAPAAITAADGMASLPNKSDPGTTRPCGPSGGHAGRTAAAGGGGGSGGSGGAASRSRGAEIYELPAVERLVYQMTALTSALTDKFPAVACQGVRSSQEGAVDALCKTTSPQPLSCPCGCVVKGGGGGMMDTHPVVKCPHARLST